MCYVVPCHWDVLCYQYGRLVWVPLVGRSELVRVKPVNFHLEMLLVWTTLEEYLYMQHMLFGCQAYSGHQFENKVIVT